MDQILNDFDYLYQGFMIITDYESHFHTLSRFTAVNISNNFKLIQKFLKELDDTYQLAIT